jgi:hypothetical protein
LWQCHATLTTRCEKPNDNFLAKCDRIKKDPPYTSTPSWRWDFIIVALSDGGVPIVISGIPNRRLCGLSCPNATTFVKDDWDQEQPEILLSIPVAFFPRHVNNSELLERRAMLNLSTAALEEASSNFNAFFINGNCGMIRVQFLRGVLKVAEGYKLTTVFYGGCWRNAEPEHVLGVSLYEKVGLVKTCVVVVSDTKSIFNARGIAGSHWSR